MLGGNPEPEINAGQGGRDAERVGESERESKRSASDWQKLHNEVVAAGGLHIVGTERHESRRIDNQLRGRSGRQGDPGSSRFYLSLEDPLLRIFASDRVAAIMERLKMPDGEAIEHPWVTRSIENAQRKVEARNFDMRKHLLEYDDVANDQRKVIYHQRNELLQTDGHLGDDHRDARRRRQRASSTSTSRRAASKSSGTPKGSSARSRPSSRSSCRSASGSRRDSELEESELRARIIEAAHTQYHDKIAAVDAPAMRGYERAIMLQSLDTHWREHLAALDHLRQGIHLRGYAQKNPTQEYKREAFELFSLLLETIKTDVTKTLMMVQFRSAEELQQVEEPEVPRNLQYQHPEFGDGGAGVSEETRRCRKKATSRCWRSRSLSCAAGRRSAATIRVPCGSGKKYKHCHGKLT